MKKTLTQKLGLLGLVSLLSYTAAVVFSPLAYPGYDWMAQAVSDLSAANAPSLALWNRLSALYNVCEVLCVMIVCVGMQGRKTRLLRTGIALFAAMEWVSAVGYRMFPLSDSGYAGAFQDQMHMIITALVVGLSVVSLVVIMIAGIRDRSCRSYGVCAAVALGMMLGGAVGMNLVPAAYFGVVERLSVLAATGFNAALGCTYETGDWQNIALDVRMAEQPDGLICHEIWHATENRILSHDYAAFLPDAWAACNPEGFRYSEDAAAAVPDAQRWTLYGGSLADVYFVDSYGRVNAQEDRARIMEYFMAHDDEAQVLIGAPAIREKLAWMCRAVRGCFDTTGWDSVRWERLL